MSEEQATAEVVEQAEAPEVSPAEAQAREKGWVSKDEWIEQGKDPEDWVTYKHFNERGEWIDERRKLHDKVKGFDERLANNNKMWEATLDDRIAQLKADKKEAIKLADDESVERIDEQLEKAKAEKAKAAEYEKATLSTPEDVAHENQWLEQNKSWYNGRTPKAAYARTLVAELCNEGLAGKKLTDEVERLIAKEFPAQNANRDKAVTDKSTPPATRKSKAVASLDQLTGEDKRIASALKNQGMTDKQIIQMINDREKR